MPADERVEQWDERDAVTTQEPDAADNEPLTAAGPPDEVVQWYGQLLSGANWFHWIAGLSLVNVVILLSGGDRSFVVGLGVTNLISGVAAGLAQNEPATATVVRAVAFVLSLIVAGVFVGFGLLSKRRFVWAFALGMTFYFFDGLLFLVFQDWLSLGFHGFALFCLFGGMTAARKLNAWERQNPAATAWAE